MASALADALMRLFPPLRDDLEDEEREALAEAVEVVRPRGGEDLCIQGSRERALYFLVEGTFALKLGDEQSAADLGFLPAGALVGEVSFFDGGPATASVVQVSPRGTALMLGAEAFERLAASHPRAAAVVCRMVSDTLAARLRVATAHYDRVMATQPRREEGKGKVLDLLRTLFGARARP